MTIFGLNFYPTDSITVLFTNNDQSIVVDGVYTTATSIKCISPVFASAGMVSVFVALNGQQYTTTNVSFLYYGIVALSYSMFLIECRYTSYCLGN